MNMCGASKYILYMKYVIRSKKGNHGAFQWLEICRIRGASEWLKKGIFISITSNIIKNLKNQTELIRIFEAKIWHYDKAESRRDRIWSQLIKKIW